MRVIKKRTVGIITIRRLPPRTMLKGTCKVS